MPRDMQGRAEIRMSGRAQLPAKAKVPGVRRNWADLCRAYRHKMGLKQEAFAQDFNVSQSTVSRWETGKRNPGRKAQARILEKLGAATPAFPPALGDPSVQSLLTMADPLVSVWDQQGRLRAASPRLMAEIASFSRVPDLIGAPADQITDDRGLVQWALAQLIPAGFFRGAVPAACVHVAPVGNPVRMAAGGSLSITVTPVRVAADEIGMLAQFEHDLWRPAPPTPVLQLMPDGGRCGGRGSGL